MDKYTQHLLNSGYSRLQIYEVVVSALRGYEQKERERRKNGTQKFRHGKDTLQGRIRKKLIENVTWFKNRRKKARERKNSRDMDNFGKNKWRHQMEKPSDSPQAVLFVPFPY